MTSNTAVIFCIGRELLEGLVLDRNANFMAGRLSAAGWRVRSIQVLDDDRESMVSAFGAALKLRPAFIFTTGGMGPGHDDITRECVAEAAALELHCDDQALEMIAKSYRRLAAKGQVADAALTEERRKMAMVPVGSVCFENPMGTAPAVLLKVGPTRFFLLPGQPQELQNMFELYGMKTLEAEGPGAHKEARYIDFPGTDESALTRVLSDAARRYPQLHTKAGMRKDGSGIRITVFGEHTDRQELARMLDTAEADLRARLGLEMQRRDRPRGGSGD
jgi:molybdenum cofactor synthesis domain-containing protein